MRQIVWHFGKTSSMDFCLVPVSKIKKLRKFLKHYYLLLYPTAKLWSVSHVSPEQHSKMFDLQVKHIANAHAQQLCSVVTGIWGIVADVRWLGLEGYPYKLIYWTTLPCPTH